MNKLYDRIYWHNNTTPALNESNLNSMSKAIDDIDDRVIQIADEVVDDIADIHQWHDETYQYRQDAEQYASDAQGYASNAQGYASSASNSATSADGYAEDSEAWAVGKRDGTDVPSSDPTYNNNSKYYAEQSADIKDDCEDIRDEIIETLGIPTFTIDFATGNLIYTLNDQYTFTVNTTTGNLEWEVVA